jgi:hypothetical protein
MPFHTLVVSEYLGRDRGTPLPHILRGRAFTLPKAVLEAIYKMLYWINWIVLLSLEPLAGELEYASELEANPTVNDTVVRIHI